MGQGPNSSVLGCNCSCSKEQEVNLKFAGSRSAVSSSNSGYETAGLPSPSASSAATRKLFPGGDADSKGNGVQRYVGGIRISNVSTQAGTPNPSEECESPELLNRGSASGNSFVTFSGFEHAAGKRPSNASLASSKGSKPGFGRDEKRPSNVSTNQCSCSSNDSQQALDTCSEASGESCEYGSDCEDEDAPRFDYQRPRRGALAVGTLDRHIFTPPHYSKDTNTTNRLLEALKGCCIFRSILSHEEMKEIVHAMSISEVKQGTQIFQQGAAGDALFVVLEGAVNCFLERADGAHRRHSFITSREAGTMFGEVSIMCSLPRSLSVYAKTNCTLGMLECKVYQNLVVQRQFRKRESREACLRKVKLLELLDDEMIAKLADALMVKTYRPGDTIITQGDDGDEFFILQSGECVAEVMTFDEKQEVKRYFGGDLFGELALLKNAKRAASITAITDVEAMYINRRSFERMLGPLSVLMKSQYLNDPRKIIADFYRPGDHRGPHGALAAIGEEPDPGMVGRSDWFAVFRPTSKDAIAKMLNGFAVGKGLNVKGKSAKKNFLSGYVPFMQIMDNDHKEMIEELPSTARIRVFYKTEAARESALANLIAVRDIMAADVSSLCTSSTDRGCGSRSENTSRMRRMKSKEEKVPLDTRILLDDEFNPKVLGLSIPGNLLREAYIMKPDLSPLVGWETGRSSEPAFMDMNLHAVSTESDPEVVLFQYDEGSPMNPHGLLIAYAEATVKPVVSDFDAFLVGSRGMEYLPLPSEQAELMNWSLERAEEVLETPSKDSWTSRWLEILKREADKGFHPHVPRYGFGDPTSYRLIGDVVAQTKACGAIRHGAECFNCYFPQELDEQYLIVWEGFEDKPWDYKSESQLRTFLIERVNEGFSFPLNPVWPIRDAGWYEVWTALVNNPSAKMNQEAWYPLESGLVERIEDIHTKFPGGFQVVAAAKKENKDRPSLNREEEASRGLTLLAQLSQARKPRHVTGVTQMYTSVMNLMPRRRSNTAHRGYSSSPPARRSTTDRRSQLSNTNSNESLVTNNSWRGVFKKKTSPRSTSPSKMFRLFSDGPMSPSHSQTATDQ